MRRYGLTLITFVTTAFLGAFLFSLAGALLVEGGFYGYMSVQVLAIALMVLAVVLPLYATVTAFRNGAPPSKKKH